VIWVDDREGSADLAPLLRQVGLTVELRRMEYGDLCWMGDGPDGPCMVGVEYKKTRDLLHSIRTGRLSGHQLPGMVRDYQHCYLLIEGVMRPDPVTGVLVEPAKGGWRDITLGQQRFMFAEVDNYLTSVEAAGGIRVRRTDRTAVTVATLKNLYQWWQKEWASHKALKAVYTPAPPTALLFDPSLVRKVAVQLPGVGWERSGAVEKRFRSVVELVRATEAEWMELPGIGKKMAQRIVAALHGEGR
jgi:ERCC4-type nuclease